MGWGVEAAEWVNWLIAISQAEEDNARTVLAHWPVIG
jgi:hypothetical protein